jgi:hypothetical protein
LFVLATVVASVGEEVGWRGYALPQLQRRFRPLPATLAPGLVWWLWHLEFFIIDKVPLSQFPAYLIEVVAVAIILTWLYNRSGGSILLVVVFHAAYNGVSITGLTTTVVVPTAILQGILLVVVELHAGRHGHSALGGVSNGPNAVAFRFGTLRFRPLLTPSALRRRRQRSSWRHLSGRASVASRGSARHLFFPIKRDAGRVCVRELPVTIMDSLEDGWFALPDLDRFRRLSRDRGPNLAASVRLERAPVPG